MGLRVLITNLSLWPPSGTGLYVRDLALELQRQGHTPVVFSSTVGDVARELRAAGIPVTDRLDRIRVEPNVIHAHQHAPAVVALRRWPTVPAIFVCHDQSSPYDRTPIHPSIRRYLGVSRVCIQRLVRDGAPADQTGLLLNFVDLARFVPRAALPERPRRALVFSNYAHEGSHLPAVVDACRRAGLELDIVGAAAGRIATDPERLLGQYDIVFAKAKAAMEAMAVGTAVILCDFSGTGPLVTSDEFDRLRPLNFGFEALRGPLDAEPLLREIARYDAADAVRVRDRLRTSAGLVGATEELVAIYRRAMTTDPPRPSRSMVSRRAIRERLFLRLYWRWVTISPASREKLKRLLVTRLVKRGVTRLFR
jgi:hypothetical protein